MSLKERMVAAAEQRRLENLRCWTAQQQRDHEAKNNLGLGSPQRAMSWSCTACTLVNDQHAKECEVCSTPRPKDDGDGASKRSGASGSSSKSDNTGGNSFGGGGSAVPIHMNGVKGDGKEWSCGTCTYSNPPGLQACEICTSAKPAAEDGGGASKRRRQGTMDLEEEEDLLICKVCTLANSIKATQCAACENDLVGKVQGLKKGKKPDGRVVDLT